MRIPETEGERNAASASEEHLTAGQVLRIVRLLGMLRLPADSWTRTDRALERLEEDVIAGAGLFSAALVGEVEDAASGHRILRAGASPAVPPPDPVRERLNRMIHALTEQVEQGDDHTER
ncbi:CATRA system-associated protein [Microbispora sp. CA-135349]|uniref:CATRA system-associated protein n=1 Tax=Microbispora sp. CA-135349 TaxID=3239953 RepID=UPI003D8B6EBC